MAKRFIANTLKTAAKTQIDMPWARGARRNAFIAKRKATPTARRIA